MLYWHRKCIYDRILRDKHWRILQEYGIDGQICLPLNLSTAYQKTVFASMVSNQSHSMWALVSGKGAFCLRSFFKFMNWIDKQRVCYDWKLQDQSFVDRKWSGFAFCLSFTESGLSGALNDFAATCDNAGLKIGTTKTEILHLSRNPDQCSLQVSEASLKLYSTGGEIQVSCGSIHEWRKARRRIGHSKGQS